MTAFAFPKGTVVKDKAFVAWLHTRPCVARQLPGHWCRGKLEVDHVGPRGLGQKSSDRQCIPLCRLAHQQRHKGEGIFFGPPVAGAGMSREERRAWRQEWCIEQAAAHEALYLSAGSRRG